MTPPYVRHQPAITWREHYEKIEHITPPLFIWQRTSLLAMCFLPFNWSSNTPNSPPFPMLLWVFALCPGVAEWAQSQQSLHPDTTPGSAATTKQRWLRTTKAENTSNFLPASFRSSYQSTVIFLVTISKKKITLQFLKCHDNDRAHPCSEAQGELGPLTSVEKLWNNVCNHGNKLLKHPIISHNSLLEGLPHGCWEQPDRRDQESQSGEGERGTWMVTQAG